MGTENNQVTLSIAKSVSYLDIFMLLFTILQCCITKVAPGKFIFQVTEYCQAYAFSLLRIHYMDLPAASHQLRKK